jgi:hypothetical protein
MSILEKNKDIIWANATELNHMTQQIKLSTEDRAQISEFLVIANEDTYNENLVKLKKHFLSVSNSKLFMDSLKNINEFDEPVWQRWWPINKTPSTHVLHASYLRIPPPYFSFTNDLHRGLPMPHIFYRPENILGANVTHTIGKLDSFYYILKPFGYDFPDFIQDGVLKFRLFDISNPHYVHLSLRDSKWKGGPTPIIKNGKVLPMMTDKEYMIAYKKYIYEKQMDSMRLLELQGK